MPEVIGALPEDVAQRERAGVDNSRAGRRLAAIPFFSDQPCDDPGSEEFRKRRLLGLAFSGGGIRSATFNLGVLQALDQLGLLRFVDYLSTVSGGGYVGSWFLSSCYHKLDVNNPASIEHLRKYSRYLAPQSGFFSADSWVIATIWIRNTLLLQLMLACFLGALLTMPRLLEQIFVHSPTIVMTVVSVIATVFAIVRSCSYLKALGPKDAGGEAEETKAQEVERAARRRALLERFHLGWYAALDEQSHVQLEIVLPLLISAFCSSAMLWHLRNATQVLPLTGILVALLIWFLVKSSFDRRDLSPYWADWAALIALACASIFMFCVHWLGGLFRTWDRDLCHDQAHWHAVILGAPLFLAAFALVIIFQIGLAGRGMPDVLREWWSRLGAFLGIYSLGVLTLGVFAVYGPLLVAQTWGWWTTMLSTGGLLTTVGGFLAANSADTNGKAESRWKELLATAAPYVFIAGLFILVAMGLHHLSVAPHFQAGAATPFTNNACAASGAPEATLALGAHQDSASVAQTAAFYWSMLNFVSTKVWWNWMVFAVLCAITALLAWRVDINQFSMNLFYRHRLVRCYMGAPRAATGQRKADQFLGFDFNDELAVARLRPEFGFSGPIGIVNTALNLQGAGDASLEERRATNFTITPYYSGSQQTGYTSTETFNQNFGGIRLGAAISTSGAAASPNSGYHTSGPVAFLMTFFNVRLGLWAANPRHANLMVGESPKWGFWYLLKELFATADDSNHFIYLSDGGHFENLAIYELIRRRCRFIIAGDAEQDGDFNFESLGGLIRKCRIDLNVEINIDVSRIARREAANFSPGHCAIGRIRYPEGFDGVLIYLKSSMTGNEDEDVLQYARQNPAFPHESTGDQFFSESQFESYHKLGKHIALDCLEDVVNRHQLQLANAADHTALESLVTDLKQKLTPRSEAARSTFAQHAGALNSIWEKLRSDRDLQFLDEQIFPGLPTVLQGPGGSTGESPHAIAPLPQDQRRFRKAFYLCQSVIQFMESIYGDLDLDGHHDDIESRGWMNLFRRWAWSSMFRVTYSLTSSTYGPRFQSFCEHHLKLTAGSVDAVESNAGDLNFLEVRILDWLNRKLPKPGVQIWRLFLVIDMPGAGGDAMRIPVGMAAVQDETLVGLRIQNHLRRMGLGTRAKELLRGRKAYRREKIVPPDAGIEGT